MSDELLFNKHDTMGATNEWSQVISRDVNGWSKDKVLGVPVDDLVDELVQKYQLDVPRLNLEGRVVSDIGESTIQNRNPYDDYGRGDDRVPVQTVTISVPFEGDRDLFSFAATTRNMNPPRATVAADKVSFTIFDRKLTADATKAKIEATIASLELHLGWLRKDADNWNSRLPKIVRDAVEYRKKDIMERDNVVASLGIPLATRENPAGFQAVSLQRRPRPVTVPTPVPKAAFTPEPVLNTAQYDDVMKAINRLATVIERNPQTFSALGETAIRDIVLVSLNSDFDRHATGETFNAAGKTDILVTEKGKNVFIAECKIWAGPKEFSEAIDQIQSYSTWRDSKTALLIFSRNADFSGVLGTIRDTVPKHSKFKKQHTIASETETRYVFRHRDDDAKEMLLAVSVFHIPDGKDRTQK